MSERKVLNKYYPPDFDPSKIPRVRQEKNRQFTVRLMAPFNMKCTTCGEYIYKGKKFNARKEDVENEDYLGIRIYRFYIKCTRCLSEISFKTDPASTDYVMEAGATRNFMALKLAEEQAARELEAEKEEERNNPMKLLENRTKASRGEIEMVETLEELKELNKRKVTINYDVMLGTYDDQRQTEAERLQIEEDAVISMYFGEKGDDGTRIKRLADDDSDEEHRQKKLKMVFGTMAKATDLLAAPQSSGSMAKKKLNHLVRPKNATDSSKAPVTTLSSVTKAPPTTSTPVPSTSLKQTTPAEAQHACEAKKNIGGLSLLGSYSDSSDNESDN